MNILLVTPFDLDAIGGVSTAVRMLAREFAVKGHNVHILVPGENKWLAKKQDADRSVFSLYMRMPLHGQFAIGSLLSYLLLMPITSWQLRRFCKRQDISAVYIQYPLPNFIYFGFLRRISRWRLVVSFQGSDAHNIDRWTGINRRALGYLIESADHVTGVAASLLKRVKSVFPALKQSTCVIPNGAAVSDCGEVEVNGDLSLPARYILAVGHLIHRKGFDVLIEAFSLAHIRCPGVHLVIVGDGAERARLTRLVKEKRLGNKVHFVGWRNHQQTLALMRQCLFYALTSRAEGLPLVLVEAMMRRKTVIATKVDGVPDIVKDEQTGLLVESEDPIATAGAIQRLTLNDVLRSRLEYAAEDTARREFTWTRIANQYLELGCSGENTYGNSDSSERPYSSNC